MGGPGHERDRLPPACIGRAWFHPGTPSPLLVRWWRSNLAAGARVRLNRTFCARFCGFAQPKLLLRQSQWAGAEADRSGRSFACVESNLWWSLKEAVIRSWKMLFCGEGAVLRGPEDYCVGRTGSGGLSRYRGSPWRGYSRNCRLRILHQSFPSDTLESRRDGSAWRAMRTARGVCLAWLPSPLLCGAWIKRRGCNWCT